MKPEHLMRILALVLLVGLFGQVFLAGLAVTSAAGWWAVHRAFVHTLAALPVIMLGVAWWAKSRSYAVFAMALLLMIGVQYLLIRADVGFVRALHPVNGVAMVLVAHAAARRVRR